MSRAMRAGGIAPRQAGLAVVTALLVVALAAAAVGAMAWRERMWVRQVANLEDAAQADAVARAGIAWAGAILAQEGRQSGIDDLGQLWARPLPPVAVGSGSVAGNVTDAQSRFNLNDLAGVGGGSAQDVAAFRRLLVLLDLPPELAGAVADWVSPPYPGALDAYYLAQEPPYRDAHRPLTDVDELYRIKGFDARIVERLRPFVTALPGYTPVNVNTAPAEVLAAVFPGLGLREAQALVASRGDAYFQSQADFAGRLTAGQLAGVRDQAFSVNSQYFLVHVHIRYHRVRVTEKALLYRARGSGTQILWKKVS